MQARHLLDQREGLGVCLPDETARPHEPADPAHDTLDHRLEHATRILYRLAFACATPDASIAAIALTLAEKDRGAALSLAGDGHDGRIARAHITNLASFPATVLVELHRLFVAPNRAHHIACLLSVWADEKPNNVDDADTERLLCNNLTTDAPYPNMNSPQLRLCQHMRQANATVRSTGLHLHRRHARPAPPIHNPPRADPDPDPTHPTLASRRLEPSASNHHAHNPPPHLAQNPRSPGDGQQPPCSIAAAPPLAAPVRRGTPPPLPPTAGAAHGLPAGTCPGNSVPPPEDCRTGPRQVATEANPSPTPLEADVGGGALRAGLNRLAEDAPEARAKGDVTP